MVDAIEADLAAHDEALRARGITLWIGAEPTFTRRGSLDAWWLSAAEGGDKEDTARALLTALAPSLSGSVELMRVKGRCFPEEPAARFAYGALWARDGRHGDGVRGSLTNDPCDPPAVDAAHAWLTVTPDPGVVEVNTAPARSAVEFLRGMRAVYEAAAAVGLSPWRAFFNGQVNDSGGGGQITLGGPSFDESLFFTHPWTLPGLVRYVHHHPSLSYLFAPACVGGASQGPRPDEGDPARFEELALSLEHLDAAFARGERVSPDTLWQTLAPLLVDGSGNSHRAELNVEKLANPHVPGRGRMGVVECRALRMARTPERYAAVGALFRAVAARVAARRYTEPLRVWGDELHDRFALPSELRADLRAVLADLDAEGFGLGEALVAELTREDPAWVTVSLGGATLAVRPALEFWTLLGDVASQERAGARWVDASATRLELEVHVDDGEAPGELTACGRAVSLVSMPRDDDGTRWLAAVRYRGFVPSPGLHPGVGAIDPLTLVWTRGIEAREVSLHNWIPGGGVYEGLPATLEEAEARRQARAVVRAVPWDEDHSAHGRRTGRFTVDLRYP